MFFKSFLILQFSYCPLLWMCLSRSLNNKIHNIHERALRIVYQDKKNSFDTFLKHNKSLSIHMVTEVFQVKNGHSSEVIKEIFVF